MPYSVATTIAAAAMPSVTGRRHPPARARTSSAPRPQYKSPCAALSETPLGKSGGREIDDSQKMNIM